jgi:hypothetical protein
MRATTPTNDHTDLATLHVTGELLSCEQLRNVGVLRWFLLYDGRRADAITMLDTLQFACDRRGPMRVFPSLAVY